VGLHEYHRKRNFALTPEPAGRKTPSRKGSSFVIQKHAASHLHYDFRLELDGVLLSWAVPKGPSLDPADKRLAMQTEDHPIEYGDFEGIIPKGQYGGGTVLLWDRGTWRPKEDPRAGYRKGKLSFELDGEKLQGGFKLVRTAPRGGDTSGRSSWLLFKERDEVARPKGDITARRPESVKSGRTMEQIAAAPEGIWDSKKGLRLVKAAPPKRLKPLPRGATRPDFVLPQLATLVEKPPAGDEWLHEVKLDGYRIVAVIDRGRARLVSRNGKDWTERFKTIASRLESAGIADAVLDGEVAVLRPDGTTSFQDLQNALGSGGGANLVYFVFDLLNNGGRDLRKQPLLERKRQLAELIGPAAGGALRYSDHLEGQGDAVFAEACKSRAEGIVSKRADAPYESGRTRSWVKVKCLKEQEFVVVGFTDPQGSRAGLGALFLAVHAASGDAAEIASAKSRVVDAASGDAAEIASAKSPATRSSARPADLTYVGKVGTGFSTAVARSLRKQLDALETDTCPCQKAPRMARAHWVKPSLVAQVAFTEWTSDGKLRHPTFHGLREDKAAGAVVREEPKAVEQVENVFAGVTLTNPDRVLYPGEGVTKRAVASYYTTVGELVLPHLADRPTTLVRCPEGIGKACFYQKHVGFGVPKTVRVIRIQEKTKVGEYIVVDDLKMLISLVQLGVLEVHTWNARADRLEQPDRLIFDLDPDPAVGWEGVVEAARNVRERLERLGLESFLKTTGGKGLHVVVPITRGPDWDDCVLFSRALAEAIEADEPDKYVTTMAKAKRKGKVFLDYLRNARGSTAVAAYSTRARPGAPVSVPIAWEELDEPSLRADAWTVATLGPRLASLKKDPWADYGRTRQRLTAGMKKELGLR